MAVSPTAATNRTEPFARPVGEGVPEGHADRWRHAACVDEDPELFFPVGATSPRTLQQEQEAKAVCARCPIIDMCRDWAVATGQTHGVWGGTSEQERAVLLRRARREKAR